MKWQHWSLTCVLAGGILFAAGNAEAKIPEDYRKAIVKVNCGQDCWGTGFVVRDDPPTIATCYHVVASRDRVTVSAADFVFEVGRIASYPKQDIAFIELKDVKPWSVAIPGSVVIPWQSESLQQAAKKLRQDDELKFFGVADSNQVDSPSLDEVKYLKKELLTNLGGSIPLAVDPSLYVLKIKQMLPYRPINGDSGGPIFDSNGNLVGMVAGYAKVYGSGYVGIFGVWLTTAVPERQDAAWASGLPTFADPYGSPNVERLVTPAIRVPTPVSPRIVGQHRDISSVAVVCARNTEAAVAAYWNRLDALPAAKDLSSRGIAKLERECAKRYDDSRNDFATYQQKSDMQLDARATVALADDKLRVLDRQIAVHDVRIAIATSPDPEERLGDAIASIKRGQGEAKMVDELDKALRESIRTRKKDAGFSVTTLKQEKSNLEAQRANVLQGKERAIQAGDLARQAADAALERALATLQGSVPGGSPP